jgi:alkanesulfonate monooxygenase SsuD/methylene tetrahydromethanopterin reductase-like flavin-dependent oxidoreductase (luciferase family)
MNIGLISHIANPTPHDVRRMAVAAEELGADWLGLPDAFWWRDTWFLAFDALGVTEKIIVGPVVTNPYLRHPVHTTSVIATLQDRFGPRIQLGLGAGGSELSAVTGISRSDAAAQIESLARLVRGVAAGSPFDEVSGLGLDIPMKTPEILIAGRSADVLRAAGRTGDRALLWSVPGSDLERSVALIRRGADVRFPDLQRKSPQVIWAPVVAHDARTLRHHLASLPYAVLNSPPSLQRGWGLSAENVVEIRRLVVSGHVADAAALIPNAAVSDLIVSSPDPAFFAQRMNELGIEGLAMPVYRAEDVASRVQWARSVEATL